MSVRHCCTVRSCALYTEGSKAATKSAIGRSSERPAAWRCSWRKLAATAASHARRAAPIDLVAVIIELTCRADCRSLRPHHRFAPRLCDASCNRKRAGKEQTTARRLGRLRSGARLQAVALGVRQ